MTDLSIFCRRPDVVSANLGAELAVLDLPAGSYFGFNPTAAHVWRLLESPRTLDQICRAMADGFEVDPAVCSAEVRSFLENLLRAGLVTTVNEPLA